jgi:hypothetical protein
LVTYHTLFVIDVHSRRVRIVGSTPHPDKAFILQIARHLTGATDGVLQERRFPTRDRDRTWSTGVRHLLETIGCAPDPDVLSRAPLQCARGAVRDRLW